MRPTKLVQALRVLNQEVNAAYLVALSGQNPNLHALGAGWKAVEAAAMQLDQEGHERRRK